MLDPATLLSALGPWVLLGTALVVFAECGLLLGFFLPGDSLLFTVGLFVASGAITAQLWAVCVVLVAAAVAGNLAGYGIGRAVGPRLLERSDGRLWKRAWVFRTEAFIARHGTKALVLGRFVPVVRTLITAMAGVGRMAPGRFLLWSAIGGTVWATGVTVLGRLLGGVPFVRDHVELMLVGVVLVSLVPVLIETLRARRAQRDEAGVR